MRVPAATLLGALALVLAGVLVTEFAARGSTAVAVPRAPRRIPVMAAAPAETGQVDRWVGTILARPLFSPSRRPAATAAAPGPAGLPRLAGVIVGPEGKTVIFASGGGGGPILAHEGERIGAYRVQSINDGAVTVRGPGGVRVLHPAFASTDAAAAAVSKPPSPGKAQSVFSIRHRPFTPLPTVKASQGNPAAGTR